MQPADFDPNRFARGDKHTFRVGTRGVGERDPPACVTRSRGEAG